MCTLPPVNDCILAQGIRSIENYGCKKSQEKPIYDLFVPRMINGLILAYLHTPMRETIHIIRASCFENSLVPF
jgi:hypothetical protein